MQLIRAALLDDRNDAPCGVSIFGRRNRGDHLYFGHGVLQRLDGAGAAHLIVAIHAIFKDTDRAVALAGQMVRA